MNKTESLKTEVKKLLKTQTDRVSYGTGPKKKIYPYVVFELSELGFSDGKTTYQLEVNAVDSGDDTQPIDDLSDNIQKKLHKECFINEDIQFTAYRGARQPVTEDNPDIIRRRMLFEIHLHELKGE